ncbi:MAG: cytochrome c family protein, partial [Candidatus Marinimicrobia bacterium]|nr:cytochrome c family protein [Candidatus Neomarinimicrobiota bacterium]
MKKVIITILTLTAFILAQDFEFVGSARCKMCHNKVEKGAQYTKWEASVHAKAFETLKSEESAKIAKGKGITVEAWKAPE